MTTTIIGRDLVPIPGTGNFWGSVRAVSIIEWSQVFERISTRKGQRDEVGNYVQTHTCPCCGLAERFGANPHDRGDVNLPGQVRH